MIKIKKTTPDSITRCESCDKLADFIVISEKPILQDGIQSKVLKTSFYCNICGEELCEKLPKLPRDYVEVQHEMDYS